LASAGAGRSSGAAAAACPQPDILINNADGPAPGDFRRWEREDWIRTLDGMMLGPIFMIRAAVDGMIERKFGRIVNISARTVKSPQPEAGLSNGSRSGLVGFVAGLARQTVRHNVTYGRTEEAGAYIAFLCSAHAGFITGQNLMIDGGQYPGTF